MKHKKGISRLHGPGSSYYRDILASVDRRLDRMEAEYGARELDEVLAERGVSRREFLSWCSAAAVAMALPTVFSSRIARAATINKRLPVIWLHFAECTGCSEGFLRSNHPDVGQIILDYISVEYHDTIMPSAGEDAERRLKQALAEYEGKFVCVCEGAIPTRDNGAFLRLDAKGTTGVERANEVVKKALATICIGTCSAFGGVQAAAPNPTQAKPVSEVTGVKTINVSGCPPQPMNFVGVVLHFLLLGSLPATDELGRPLFAYGSLIHDNCERGTHFANGEYVQEFGDEGAMKGFCLAMKGCKGPETHSNCPRIRFNDGTNWPVGAGHPCIGCTEPDFWDNFNIE